jgi:hypothetical protein
MLAKCLCTWRCPSAKYHLVSISVLGHCKRSLQVDVIVARIGSRRSKGQEKGAELEAMVGQTCFEAYHRCYAVFHGTNSFFGVPQFFCRRVARRGYGD